MAVLCDRLTEDRNDLGKHHNNNVQAVAYLAYLRLFIERAQTALAKLDHQIQDIETMLSAEKGAKSCHLMSREKSHETT